MEQAHVFTFSGDEKQSEVLQNSDSLIFFKILINHEAFWQPPWILHHPYLISHRLSAYSAWSQPARFDATGEWVGLKVLVEQAAGSAQDLCQYPLGFCKGGHHDKCSYMNVEHKITLICILCSHGWFVELKEIKRARLHGLGGSRR